MFGKDFKNYLLRSSSLGQCKNRPTTSKKGDTGKMGLARMLAAEKILSQPLDMEYKLSIPVHLTYESALCVTVS